MTRIKSVLFVLFLLSLIAVPRTAPLTAQTSVAAPGHVEIFLSIWETVNTNFFDPGFAGVDWHAIKEKYRPLVENAKEDRTFKTLMEKMLGEIPVSHLRILTSADPDQASINVRFRQIQGQLIVHSVDLVSDARTRGIRAGDLVLTRQNLWGQLGTVSTIRVRGCDSKERSVDVRREQNAFPADKPNISWHRVNVKPGDRIGYLNTTHFDDAMVPLIDAAMSDLKDTSGIIIDVRNNSGGNNSLVRLVSYFVSGEQVVYGLLTRGFLDHVKTPREQVDPAMLPKVVGVYSIRVLLQSLRKSGAIAMYTEDLGNKTYKGKIVVLINAGSASAAEGFAAIMKEKTSAMLVGEMTAGHILTSDTFPLANGWKLVVPIAVPILPSGRWFKDTPTKPQIEVKWTREDLCEGRDPDIAKAMEILAAP